MTSELLKASPFMDESNELTKSLNVPKVSPRVTSEWLQFSKTDKIAWVAQALLMTCFAKNMSSNLESWTTDPEGSSPGRYLKRNIKPWMGLRCSKLSEERLQSSSTWTPLTPNPRMSSLNTPGSDSIKHHSPADDMMIPMTMQNNSGNSSMILLHKWLHGDAAATSISHTCLGFRGEGLFDNRWLTFNLCSQKYYQRLFREYMSRNILMVTNCLKQAQRWTMVVMSMFLDHVVLLTQTRMSKSYLSV